MRARLSRAAFGVGHVCLAIMAMAVLVACNRPSSDARFASATMRLDVSLSPQSAALTPQARQQLAELRAVTAPYREVKAAKAAGFIEITGCMSDPVKGGMGELYGMTSRFDGKPQHNAPEILVYAPEENGKLRLAAIQFAVPFNAWTSEKPPELFGQQFHKNAVFGLWVLQAWIWKTNPSGMFTDYNPLATCENA